MRYIIDIIGNKGSVPDRFRVIFFRGRNPEGDSQITESAGNFRDRVMKSGFRVPEHFFDNADAFDAGDYMLCNDADSRNHRVENSVFSRQFFSAGLLFRLTADCAGGFAPLKAGIFENRAAAGKNRIFFVR